MPHRATAPAPSQFLWTPKAGMSMWANDVYGDCTVAEEAFAKSCTADVFVTDSEVVAWAQVNGAINGDTLIDVLDKMQAGGFALNGKTYDDGVPLSVDWTNQSALQAAIAEGPVKIGVAADQLENVVPNPPESGWFGSGFSVDANLDHCVSASGYGPISWLLEQLGGTIPGEVSGTQPGIAIFTWNSQGVLDWPSFLAITGEAWIRNPTSLTK
jgi:hypothetical protein